MKSIPRFFAPPGPAFPSRREFLTRAGNGFGMLALAGLLEDQGLLGRGGPHGPTPRNPLAPRPGHVPAKARSVIWLFMNGGPSQVDTWDYKPELAKRDGQALKGFDKNTGFFTDQVGPVMKSPFRFSQHGECGKWGSEIFPNIARHVDKMAFIHSCWTTSNNHSPALFMINTGMSRMGFPCVGSWVTYGLGSQNKSLPGFVTMYDTLGRGLPKGNASNWGSGFLPSIYQGTVLKPTGAPDRQPVPRRRGQRPRAAVAARPAEEAQPAAPRTFAATIRSWPPASKVSSWLTACRWPPPNASTSKGVAGDAAALRARQPAMHARRQAVPHRPPAGRAGRAVRADLQRRHGERAELGRPPGHRQKPRRLRRRGRHPHRRPVDRSRRPAACWTRRWSSAAANSAACRSCKRGERAATTIRTPSPPGWPAAEPRGASPTARRTKSASRRS